LEGELESVCPFLKRDPSFQGRVQPNRPLCHHRNSPDRGKRYKVTIFEPWVGDQVPVRVVKMVQRVKEFRTIATNNHEADEQSGPHYDDLAAYHYYKFENMSPYGTETLNLRGSATRRRVHSLLGFQLERLLGHFGINIKCC
jgi:hypothetical protein